MQAAIYTAQAEAERIAFRELKAVVPGLTLTRMLAPGVGLLSLPGDFATFARVLHAAPPVFVRHICPVTVQVALTGQADDLPKLVEAVRTLMPGFLPNAAASVQTRALGALPGYKCFDVNAALAEVLSEAGLTLDIRKPSQVLSVVLDGEQAHLGVSSVMDNRSDWAGGCRRYAHKDARISRAEFKLLEALEVFGVDLPEQGRAVDLGAAPGGWTQVLHDRGLQVIAVDPARLDARLDGIAGIEHRAVTAQVFFTSQTPCDVLVNDMKMDSAASAALMCEAVPSLTPGGWAILTLKLPAHDWEKRVHSAVRRLEGAYSNVQARQLFHNRSEVTCVMRR